MTVAELFVKCLENEGVTRIFGVPGEENEALLFALDASEKIEFIPTRHEQGAAFIADVWGRLTGKAGVCLGTLGPGATNLVTGVADANLDKSPVVAITGQGSMNRLHHESHQNIDVVKMFEPITKWNSSINDRRIVSEVIRKAFKTAQAEKPGATHIELPEDIADLEVRTEQKPLQKPFHRRPGPESQCVTEAFKLIEKAKKPLILAGNGAIRNRASGELTRLAEAFNIPVAATFMGKGAVSDNKKQSLLAMGLGFKDYVMEAAEKADLFITVGYDIAEYSPAEWNPNKDKKIIHIDFELAETYQSYAPDVEISADIALSLKAIFEKLSEEKYKKQDDWYLPIRERILEDIASYDLKKDDKLTVPGTLNVIREVMDDDGILISDVGAHKMWIARNFKTCSPNSCIISNGLASMGISLPGGIAASLVDDDRQVVSLMGDGGFMMNMQELETAKRLGVGYTIIIVNNNDYGLISWKQERHQGRSTGTRLTNPDFVKLAESFGIEAYRPTTPKALKSVLKKAIPNKKLTLVEVPISDDVNGELIKKLKDYWS